MARVLVVSQYFPPELGAPQARLSELGRVLAARGWDVEVLTALPNYPAGEIFQGYDPRRPVRERLEGMDVVRVPLLPARSGFVGRLACYFSFVLSCRVFAPRLCKRPDVMFVESPPLFIGYLANGLRRRWQAPYVFNVSDLWPESAVRMNIIREGFLSRRAERLELSFYRRAAAVTGQSEEIVESIRRRCPGVETRVVSNGVEPARFGREKASDEARAALKKTEANTVFVYAGLLGLAQGLDQILDVAHRVKDTPAIRFVMAGDGPVRAHLQERARREELKSVDFLGAQQRDFIPGLLAASDVALVTLGTRIPGAVPSKIYEAMASSLPILLVAEGEAARRVERVSAGMVVGCGNLDGLERAVRELHRNEPLRKELGAAGRRAAENVYNRARAADVLDELLRRVVEHSGH